MSEEKPIPDYFVCGIVPLGEVIKTFRNVEGSVPSKIRNCRTPILLVSVLPGTENDFKFDMFESAVLRGGEHVQYVKEKKLAEINTRIGDAPVRLAYYTASKALTEALNYSGIIDVERQKAIEEEILQKLKEPRRP